MALHVNKNLCILWFPYLKIIWIYQCLSLPCACLPPPLAHRVFIIDSLLHCADFFVCLFVCFHRNRICCPSINQTSPSQSKGLFPFIIICRQKKYLQTGTLGLCMSAWTENNLCIHWKIISTWHIMVKFGSHKYKKITWLDKNQALRMILSCISSCEDHELWKLSTVFVHWCYQPVFVFFVCVFFLFGFSFTNIHEPQDCRGRGEFVNSSLPLPPTSQTLRH